MIQMLCCLFPSSAPKIPRLNYCRCLIPDETCVSDVLHRRVLFFSFLVSTWVHRKCERYHKVAAVMQSSVHDNYKFFTGRDARGTNFVMCFLALLTVGVMITEMLVET